MPRGTNLFAGLGALLLGVVLVWSAAPRALRWLAMAGSPVLLFFSLYVVHLALPALPLIPPVAIQLHAESGLCWGASFSAPKRNHAMRFQAVV